MVYVILWWLPPPYSYCCNHIFCVSLNEECSDNSSVSLEQLSIVDFDAFSGKKLNIKLNTFYIFILLNFQNTDMTYFWSLQDNFS